MQVLILGAGQLARMMSLAATPLNINVLAFDVTTNTIVHPISGQTYPYSLEQAIAQSDVITAEFEHIAHDILDLCQQSGKLFPAPETIKIGGDREKEKALLDNAQVASAPYHIIHNQDDLISAITAIGLPLVLKSTLGGYDGKGQWRLHDQHDVASLWPQLAACIAATPNQAIIAEAWIPFQREVSIIGVRDKQGNITTYPLTENIHTNGVLSLSTALIEDNKLQQQANCIFSQVAEQLDYVGVLAIELFDVNDQLLVNEIAPRVHNSGHWTQQGTLCCQFANHIRAVCGLPCGDTAARCATAMINILGIDSLPTEIYQLPYCSVHWYGKEARVGRKMGHINVTTATTEQLQLALQHLGSILPETQFPALPREH
ncbi:TPA: 5-(carboxyamino)imidazole ribonucleotide synthase [Photobacterium damselae]